MKNHGITEYNIAKINQIARKKAYEDPTDIDFVLDTLQNAATLDITQKEEFTDLVSQIEQVIATANSTSISRLVYQIMMSIYDLYQRAISDDLPQNRRYQGILKEIYKIALDYETLNPMQPYLSS